jgi:hypothetical protein
MKERLHATYALKKPAPVLSHELTEYLKEALLYNLKLIPF